MSKGKVGEEEVELMLKRQLFFLVLQPLPSLVILVAVGGGKYHLMLFSLLLAVGSIRDRILWKREVVVRQDGDAEQEKGGKGKLVELF